MSRSKSHVALTFAAMLAASSQSIAQTQPDPHHPAPGAGTTEAVPGNQDQQSMSMPMMMKMMSGMMKMMGGEGDQMGMAGAEHIRGRIAFLRAELQITDAQAKAWDVFAGVLQDNAERIKEMNMPMMSGSPKPQFMTQLDSQERILVAKLEEVRTTKATYAALHEVLSEEQRKMVDELLQNHTNMMPPGMMQRGMMMKGSAVPMQQNMQ